MIIGSDFDNTIISYDELFHSLALSKGLITETLPVRKNAIRDLLEGSGKTDEWVKLQAEIYGRSITKAKAFPGAIESIQALLKAGHKLCIISHKSQLPFAGDSCDLHQSARNWLELNLLAKLNLEERGLIQIFFEPTREAKVKRIAGEGCEVFIDDLPEVFAHPGFPLGVKQILFDPFRAIPEGGYELAHAWTEIAKRIGRI